MLKLSFVVALALLVAGGAHAERADRQQPMVVESDGKQAASVDLSRKVTLISGNVVIVQGTLLIKGDQVEVHEESPGRYVLQARALPNQQVYFKQKRDRPDEWIEAHADRVNYDGGTETVRFTGNAHLRALRAGVMTDEGHAGIITYDQKIDTLVFEGGTGPAPTTTAPNGGRARLVFVPRAASAAEPARPANAATGGTK